MGETLVEIDSTMLLINQFTANLSDWELLKNIYIYLYKSNEFGGRGNSEIRGKLF